jgi:hypothetical protein
MQEVDRLIRQQGKIRMLVRMHGFKRRFAVVVYLINNDAVDILRVFHTATNRAPSVN